MTASELADELDNMLNAIGLTDNRVPTMLRQQQAEIEALKQIIDANNLSQNIGQFVKPTNEPVAWMFRCYLYEKDPSGWTVHEHPDVPVIPLYTHPVELTDEEIDAVGDKVSNLIDTYAGRREFARAILRKAQE